MSKPSDPKKLQTEQPSPGPASTFPSTLPSVNLPKGGGAIKGLDEKLSVNAINGTASTSINIPTTPGRSGFGPQLSWSCDSGAGNGIFGLGWQLSWPEVARKIDKGLPLYADEDESDEFILYGAEDLVPALQSKDGSLWEQYVQIRDVDGRQFQIFRYRPRLECTFSLIERWTDVANGASHWRTISGSNITTIFGFDDRSRVFDPNHPSRVYRWLISHTYDDKGNAMIFEYKSENADALSLGDSNEANIEPCVRMTQRYPKRVKYGNRTSRIMNPRLEALDWMFEVVFDYGDHDAVTPSVGEAKPWSIRSDSYSNRRPGFEIRTYRLCKRILMFHNFPNEPNVGANCCVSSLDISYHLASPVEDFCSKGDSMIASCISSVAQTNYVRKGYYYVSATMPSTEFTYSLAKPASQICDLQVQSIESLPAGVDGQRYFFLDLDGEGLPGIVTYQGNALYYSANEGAGQFSAPHCLPFQPSWLNENGSSEQWLDLAGDGQIDLVQLRGPTPGFCKHDRESPFDWSNFTYFKSFPNMDITGRNVRLIDLTGDGHSDISILGDQLFT